MNSLADIERAIDGLKPQELAELYAWLDRHRPASITRPDETVFEHGLGLFGSPEDAALMDEVVDLAYEERRRPGRIGLLGQQDAATTSRHGGQACGAMADNRGSKATSELVQQQADIITIIRDHPAARLARVPSIETCHT